MVGPGFSARINIIKQNQLTIHMSKMWRRLLHHSLSPIFQTHWMLRTYGRNFNLLDESLTHSSLIKDLNKVSVLGLLDFWVFTMKKSFQNRYSTFGLRVIMSLFRLLNSNVTLLNLMHRLNNYLKLLMITLPLTPTIYLQKRSYASVTHVESRNNLSQQSKLDNIKSIELNDDDLIIVEDSSTVVLIKVKEIETIRNMYHVCQAEGFVDVKIHYIGGLWVWLQFSSVNSCEAFKYNESLNKLWTFIKFPSPSFVVDERVIWIEVSGLPLCAWGSSAFKKIANLFGKFNFFDDDVKDSMCMGRACITTKIQPFISEKVNVTIKDLNFNVHVKEIGTWSTLIFNDMDSNESDDDHDMEEHRSTNEDVDLNAALDDFIQQNIVKESALKDSKEGDQANVSTHVAGDNETLFSGKLKKEYFVIKEDKPSEEDVLDTSKPPGFENFIKENSECSISFNASRLGKCSTSFGNYKRKELKGFSFIGEMSRMIEVGGTLGYDVKGCKKYLRKMINGI
nr:hypothetical protein [Tanacetum cinerariifolium]